MISECIFEREGSAKRLSYSCVQSVWRRRRVKVIYVLVCVEREFFSEFVLVEREGFSFFLCIQSV